VAPKFFFDAGEGRAATHRGMKSDGSQSKSTSCLATDGQQHQSLYSHSHRRGRGRAGPSISCSRGALAARASGEGSRRRAKRASFERDPRLPMGHPTEGKRHASTMTTAPTLSSTAASTMPLAPPAGAAAAAMGMGQQPGQEEAEAAAAVVVVVRIAGHRFVPDHVLLRGRGRSVRWVNEEEDGCVRVRQYVIGVATRWSMGPTASYTRIHPPPNHTAKQHAPRHPRQARAPQAAAAAAPASASATAAALRCSGGRRRRRGRGRRCRERGHRVLLLERAAAGRQLRALLRPPGRLLLPEPVGAGDAGACRQAASSITKLGGGRGGSGRGESLGVGGLG
jgi:hypothetical protein